MRRTRIATLATAVAAASLMVGASLGSAQSPSAPAAGASTLKIGVVTDVGTLDDKNFNEYTFKGAVDGAAAVGAATPPSDRAQGRLRVRSGHPGLHRPGLQRHRHDRLQPRQRDDRKPPMTTPTSWFIGVDQTPICVDADGLPDATFACAGDAATLLPKLVAIGFAEDQAGYLAGIVAASISKTGSVAAIGGTSACAAVRALHPGL